MLWGSLGIRVPATFHSPWISGENSLHLLGMVDPRITEAESGCLWVLRVETELVLGITGKGRTSKEAELRTQSYKNIFPPIKSFGSLSKSV